MTTPTEICERLDAIRVRADRATPGPWAFESHGRDGDYGVGVLVDEDNNPVSGQQETGVMLVVEPVAVEVRNQLDAKFIANARDDVPFLLDLITTQAAEIERLMKERDEARLDSAGFKRVADDFTKIASHAQQAEITTSKRAEAAEAALEKMRSVEKIIEFWFAPWGSWKTETWEDMSGDQPYSADAALALIRAALTTQGGGE